MYVSVCASEPDTLAGSSSLRPPKEHLAYAPFVAFPRTIQVETIKIDSWADANGIERIDMMWLDMQGVELEVLKSSPKMVSTTRVILTEVSFVEAYENQSYYHEIKNWLEEQGFDLVWCGFNPYHPTSDGQWFGDALFIRRELL